ncbi:MAG: Gx transporter family protein [Clostridia bacterium]|nr:Gx transporter family protein [Clostridia bacterium]
MKLTSSSVRTRYVAECASLFLLSLALTYLETLIPFASFMPLPGFKPGLANIVVVAAFFRLSPAASFVISLSKVAISGILFWGITTTAFSACGALLSFITLCVLTKVFGSKIGFIGLSVSMALAHNIGQLACAALLMSNASVFSYFPALSAASLIFGSLTGAVLSSLPERIYLRKGNDT